MNENLLFQYLKENYIPDLQKFDNQYNSTDCYSNKLNMIIELKSRSDYYNGYIIQKDKYDALIDSKYKNKRYINSIKNEKIMIWDVNEIIPTFFTKSCKQTTEFEKNEYIDKNVAYLFEWMTTKIITI